MFGILPLSDVATFCLLIIILILYMINGLVNTLRLCLKFNKRNLDIHNALSGDGLDKPSKNSAIYNIVSVLDPILSVCFFFSTILLIYDVGLKLLK